MTEHLLHRGRTVGGIQCSFGEAVLRGVRFISACFGSGGLSERHLLFDFLLSSSSGASGVSHIWLPVHGITQDYFYRALLGVGISLFYSLAFPKVQFL